MSALSLPSSVTSVTVFRRGALVTRTATLERGAEGFPAAVRLEGLPLLLDDDSLQVALHPVREGSREGVPEGQAPMAGDLRVTLAVPPADEALAPPTDAQLEAARLELATARQAHTDLEGIRRQVAELGPGVRGTPEEGAAPMASPTEARLALVALRRERLERLRTEVLEAAERVRLAQERLATLEERERRSSSARNPRTFEARKAVVVSLLPAVGHPAARLELRLRYFVVGARWAPTYVLRLDPSLRAGTLELRALVGQATGEPWNNVALTLSTAHPQRWTELPELHSLRIGRHQPPPAKTGWRPPPPGTELLYADYDRLGRAPGKAAGAGEPEDEDTMMFDADEEAATLDPGMDLEEIQAIAAEATASFALPETEVRTQARDKKRRPSARTSRPMPPPAAAPMAPPMPMASMPPPGMAIPGDAPMMPMQAESKRGGLGGMIGAMMSSGGGPQADLVPAHGFEEPEEPPHTLMADRDQLAYGELWLPPADDAHRGALRRIGRAQRYGRLAALSPDQIRVALERGEQARAGARALEDRSPPGAHCWVEPVDGFDYAYPAQARVSLDSDGELHGLPLQSPAVETQPRYICVPRESSDVFQVMVLRNPIDAPLLPGPVDVYLGGRFALASTLETTPPRGRVELGLGVEQGIKVARNVSFEDKQKGMIKRHQQLEHWVRVQVRNLLTQPARVEIRERLPVTRPEEDDIEITEHTVEPAWHELEQDDPPLEGGRVWTVEVPPASERTLSATWSIRIPPNYELIGGNRREG